MSKQQSDTFRILPADETLEQEIIGALVRDNSLYEHVCETIKEEYFVNSVHRALYSCIQKLILRGSAATPINICHQVKLEQQDAIKLVTDMVVNVIAPTPNGIKAHAQQLYDLYLRRKLIAIGDRLSSQSIEDLQEPWAFLEEAEQSLFSIADSQQQSSSAVSITVAVHAAVQHARTARDSGKHISGIPTGLLDLDTQLGGLHDSDLVILAGRPSMGKTALGTCIAYNAAKAGYPTTLFSLEMSSEQLGNRLLSQVAELPSDRVRRGAFNNTELGKLVQAAQDFEEPLYIDDSAALTLENLRTRIRRAVRGGTKLVMIDYLQLLSLGRRKVESRLQELSEITRTLKSIAKDMNIPILALSQLSRAVEQREDKKPQLADLRESGTIEQDADVVMFIFREAYYLMRAKPDEGSEKMEDWQRKMSRCHNQADVMIAKQRHGPIGNVKLHYDGRYTKFSNFADSHYDTHITE